MVLVLMGEEQQVERSGIAVDHLQKSFVLGKYIDYNPRRKIRIPYPTPLLMKLSLLVPLGLIVKVIGTSVIENPSFFARIRISAVTSKFFETNLSRIVSMALVE
jgi:hypothetical protein